jgi:threonine synthase
LLLGAYLGFSQLKQAKEIAELPRLVGVQSEHCAPLFMAHQEGRRDPHPFPKTETVAEGISVADPVRGRQILEAVRRSQGFFVTVTDEEVIASLRAMAKIGFYLEPTSATATAAWEKIKAEEAMAEQTIVIPLTGSGLKAGSTIGRVL